MKKFACDRTTRTVIDLLGARMIIFAILGGILWLALMASIAIFALRTGREIMSDADE